MTTSQLHARRQWGFTLIELLVVVSIVSLLVAILLPSLVRAREVSRRVKCLSGARQVLVATQAYIVDYEGWFPAETVSPSQGYQALLVNGRYANEPLFTNKGCPDGPAEYSSSRGSYFYAKNPGNVAFGLNHQLQTGYGVVYPPPTPGYTYTNYGPYNAYRERRLERRPDMVFVSSCSLAPVAGTISLRHTMGVTDFYYGNVPVEVSRHRGEGLNMAFYDGHGSFVEADEINPAPMSTSPPYTMMQWSLLTKHQGVDMDH